MLWRRVRLTRQIVEMRSRVDSRGRKAPVPWRTVAKQLGISEDTAQRYYADFAALREPVAPTSVVDDAIALRERMLEELDALWENCRDDHPSAAVGAMRAMLEIDVQRIELMQAAGKVPYNMSRWRAEADFSEIVRGCLIIMEKHGVGEPVLAEIHEFVRSRLPTAPDSNVRSIGAARRPNDA